MKRADLAGAIQAAWAADAPIYDDLPGHGLRTYEERARLAAALAAAFGSRPRQVLDVGTGTGAVALLLAALGHRVTGVDLTGAMLDVARRKAAALDLDVTFVQSDAAHLPMADGSVDGVISRHLFWTLPDPVGALREWARVTRTGGVIAVMDGLWRDRSVAARLRGAVARPVRRLFAPPGRAHSGYDTLGPRLPLFGGATPAQVAALMREAGLADVAVRDLAGLRRAENAARPWYNRLDAPRITWLATARVASRG